MVRGALTTLVAVLAIDHLDLGDSGVGLLGSAIGIGGLERHVSGARKLAADIVIAFAHRSDLLM